MLARLDRELAPLRAQTDRSGTWLRVVGEEEAGGGLRARLEAVLRDLGYRLGPPAADAPPERWYGAGEVVELSIEEAGTLSRRWAAEIAERLGLGPEKASGLRKALLYGLLKAMQTYPLGEDRARSVLLQAVGSHAGFLSVEERAAVTEWLEGTLAALTGATAGPAEHEA